MQIQYLQLLPESLLPKINLQSFRAILVIEENSSPEWQILVSEWFVKSGCLYLMAWGQQCSLWHDSVDMANIKRFDYGEIPDEAIIMTTWHENEQLKDVYWFSKNNAFHPTVELHNTIIVHISRINKENEMLTEYNSN